MWQSLIIIRNTLILIRYYYKRLFDPNISSVIAVCSHFEGSNYEKILQVSYLVEKFEADTLALSTGDLDLKFIHLLKKGNHLGKISICSCCPFIGWMPDLEGSFQIN